MDIAICPLCQYRRVHSRRTFNPTIDLSKCANLFSFFFLDEWCRHQRFGRDIGYNRWDPFLLSLIKKANFLSLSSLPPAPFSAHIRYTFSQKVPMALHLFRWCYDLHDPWYRINYYCRRSGDSLKCPRPARTLANRCGRSSSLEWNTWKLSITLSATLICARCVAATALASSTYPNAYFPPFWALVAAVFQLIIGRNVGELLIQPWKRQRRTNAEDRCCLLPNGAD